MTIMAVMERHTSRRSREGDEMFTQTHVTTFSLNIYPFHQPPHSPQFVCSSDLLFLSEQDITAYLFT